MKSKDNLQQDFEVCRRKTMDICSHLEEEDFTIQVKKFASPPMWHLGHTTWFFEEMVLKKSSSYKVYDKSYGYLFNSYYNSVGNRVSQEDRGDISEVSVINVYAYRNHVDKEMRKLIENGISDKITRTIEVGINHEQQHQELLYTDIKIAFYSNPELPVYNANSQLNDQSVNKEGAWIAMKEGVYDVGSNGNSFSYDNELGKHKVYLQQYEISNKLVTVAEYLEFIEAGGYADFNYWLAEGWEWVKDNDITSPMYWVKKDDDWYEFTLQGLVPLKKDKAVCHVSFFEAHAFAAWKGRRLPTEFEWEAVSDELNWGDRWEWTNSAYLPYPGFKIAKGALGEYNGKFMVNQMVLRGASIVTSKNHSRSTYRNFFSTSTRWQYSGFRLVK
ncbi:MAG: ergothioneine biosynthesis protein EgtB [Glaciecola sp.]|jgi:ergothioneine biosynthesis protein EgtB